MRMRGVVFGSRSSSDPVRQITATAPFRRSITPPVQEVRDASLVQIFNGSNVADRNRSTVQSFNSSREEATAGTSHLRILEASKDKTGLRCNSHLKPDVDP
jgi:hypothetical protein